MSRLLSILKNKLKAFYNIGVEKENDESKQKYIVLLNMLSVNAICVLGLTAILLAFNGNILAGCMGVLCSVLFLFPIYFNKKGLSLVAKLFIVIYADNVILLFSCWFSHDTKLDNYFLIVLVISIFQFSYDERKWLYMSVFLSFAYYIIESTSLQNYLPAYNMLVEFDKANLILLGSFVLLISLDLIAFVYISRLREVSLISKQKMLQNAQHQLQVQNEDLQTFSIAASHSLQTPIHVSKFFLNKIKENEAPFNKSIDIIENSLNQMDQLVAGLFSYNQIIKIEEAYTTFDVISEFNLIKKRMEEKFIGSKIIIPSGHFYITTNQMLFSIILQNLVDNGLKYNLSHQPIVKLHFEQNNVQASFFVSDNGIGIDEKNFNKLFEPFKRFNIGGQFKGNGLGLSGAKRAAERIGGKLTCKESAKTGSTFQLDIPFLSK